MSDSEHLQWIHDRIVNVYGESENAGFLIIFRTIINDVERSEKGFKEYLDYIEKRKPKKDELD